MNSDGSTPFTKAEARAVLGPMLLVALKAAGMGAKTQSADADERERMWEEFSAATNDLIETMRKLELIGEGQGTDGH